MGESNRKTDDPPRLTIAQAIVIGVILVLGLFWLEDTFSLVFLLGAMGLAAFVLNRLFQVVLHLATGQDAKDNPQQEDDE